MTNSIKHCQQQHTLRQLIYMASQPHFETDVGLKSDREPISVRNEQSSMINCLHYSNQECQANISLSYPPSFLSLFFPLPPPSLPPASLSLCLFIWLCYLPTLLCHWCSSAHQTMCHGCWPGKRTCPSWVTRSSEEQTQEVRQQTQTHLHDDSTSLHVIPCIAMQIMSCIHTWTLRQHRQNNFWFNIPRCWI